MGNAVTKTQSTVGSIPLLLKEQIVEARVYEELGREHNDKIRKLVYGIDSDGDFRLDAETVGGDRYINCVILSNSQNWGYKEVFAVRKLLAFYERGTRMTEEILAQYAQAMGQLGNVSAKRQNGKYILQLAPPRGEVPSQEGHISTVLIHNDDDDDWLCVARTPSHQFVFVIYHQSVANSYSDLQTQAFKDALHVCEPGDKLDEASFFQYVEVLRSKYGVVRVYEAGDTRDSLVAHIIPTKVDADHMLAALGMTQGLSAPRGHGGHNSYPRITELSSSDDENNNSHSTGTAGHSPGLPIYDDGAIRATKLIVESGQATVYKGRREGDNDEVAIKVFHTTSDWRAAKKEIMALLRLAGHANVMEVLDFFEQPKPCVVMRFIENGGQGDDLSDYLEKNGAMPADMAERTAIGIARGLQHLHSHRIVHRDMKSPNVLLDYRRNNRPIIIDLGLATDGGQTLQDATAVMGTFFWMAPEMMDSQQFSEAGDIYALGVIMHECCTGKNPYHDFNFIHPLQFMKHVVDGGRPNIELVSQRGQRFDNLRRILRDCWVQDASARPTADQVTSRLENPNGAAWSPFASTPKRGMGPKRGMMGPKRGMMGPKRGVMGPKRGVMGPKRGVPPGSMGRGTGPKRGMAPKRAMPGMASTYIDSSMAQAAAAAASRRMSGQGW
jgi:Protein kinase domain